MTMKTSFGSILEYQIDQPSIQLPGPLTDPLHHERDGASHGNRR
jgi:hypothetical protein